MSEQAEQLLDLPRHTAGTAAEVLVRAANECGYTVGATGPGAYRLARARRKMVFGKQTESVIATVFEDRTGTKVRLVGSVDDAVIAQLTDGTPSRSTAPPATPTTSRPPSESSLPVVGTPLPAPPPNRTPVSPPTAAPPLADTAPPTGRPVSPAVPPAPGLITGLPGGSADLPDDIDRTIARPARSGAPQLLLPDGRTIALATPVVIGRDPDASRGPDGATGVAVDDRSVSKTHLAVALVAGRVEVTDLHSTNGTSVSGAAGGGDAPCESGVPTAVAAGSVIVAGDVRLVVREAS